VWIDKEKGRLIEADTPEEALVTPAIAANICG
jgi:hypothetical protein